MGSSEVMDSGRFPAAQKSNFAHTCSRLSQYLKEKGSFGDLSLGLTRNFEPNGPPTKTMNLLPMIEKTGKNSDAPAAARTPSMPVNLFGTAFPKGEAQKKTDDSVVKAEPETAQMTIFYNGQVMVFNDFPADKAKEIMLLAGQGTSLHGVNTYATVNMVPKPAESATTNLVTSSPTIVPSFANNLVQESAQKPLQPNFNDFPIARKASLTKFLEKRKDRITARAPYPVGAAVSKPAESKTWLGFAPQFPVQMERHA
ncbi:unnamed protein product [Coffea canephora]|uniref:Protein TIFY n=2 Tax=Coffea TaxID=13442 RepID=A0A068U610_COFCA|nr:protein TIFY 10A-like [Coffea arabica]CDP03053.1 unnamed protein product [Coffea canephora]